MKDGLEQELCEDAVSRKSVITIIQNHWWNCRDIDKLVNELPPVTPQESRWIPVSERLPDREEYIANNGRFIVSDGERSYSEYFDIYDKECFGEPTMYGFRVDRVVAAWMPLPEPYKEDKE